MEGIYNLILSIELIIGVLIGVAFITLAERKILGRMQRRVGPEKVGIRGILQPISDGLKLFLKENITPKEGIRILNIISPIWTLILGLIVWKIIPLKKGIVIMLNKEITEYGILYILVISSLSVIGLLYSGWSSNTRYGVLGAIRGIAQMISYEVSIGIIILSVIVLHSTLNIEKIIENQIIIKNIWVVIPIFILFLISILAETNRPPFDLPEAESELVAGFLVEYSGFSFASLYLAEYSFIMLMSSLTSLLFFGALPWEIETIIIIFFYIWIRGTLPRLRYDQLMRLGWTRILPLSISMLVMNITIMYL